MAGWYDALKDAVSFAEKLRDAELSMRMVAVRVECVHLAEENVRLREELIALREQASLRAEMEFRDNAYWRKNEGPFCPKCFDGGGRPARMTVRDESDFWRCPVCDLIIDKPGRHFYGPGRAITEEPSE